MNRMNPLSFVLVLLFQIRHGLAFCSTTCPSLRQGYQQQQLLVPLRQLHQQQSSLPSRQKTQFSSVQRHSSIGVSTGLTENATFALDNNDDVGASSSTLWLTSPFVADEAGKEFQLDSTTTNYDVLSAMKTWGNKETLEAAQEVQKILDRTEQEYPNLLHTGHYTIVVNAWAKSRHMKSADMADSIVKRMKARGVIVSRVTYNVWMNAHAIRRNVYRVEEILKQMENDIPDDIVASDYNILISAYARLGQAGKAEHVVKRMIDRYNENKLASVLPDITSYNLVLDAWSKSDEDGRGARAELILDALEERQDLPVIDNRLYVSAMGAIIRSGEKNILQRVEAIRARAIEKGILLDAYFYSTLLHAYATIDQTKAYEKVNDILEMAEGLDDKSNGRTGGSLTVVYNTALKLFKESNDPRGRSRAQQLFKKMKLQGRVDNVSYSIMITLCTDVEHAELLLKELIGANLKADTYIMNAMMNAWLKLGKVDNAKIVLDQMEDAYNKSDRQDMDLAPNVVSYSTLMNGWVKSKEPEKALEVFDRMRAMYESGNDEAKPNRFSYVTLVDSIVKSGQTGSAERAEKIVLDMYAEYKKGNADAKPNARLVSSVIDCWKDSGDRDAGERAEAMLNWLIDTYQKEGDKVFLPCEYSFASSKF
jgi:pentatricopeptide repeat protein